MTNENGVIEEEESQTSQATPAEQTEQATIDSEVVENTGADGKDYKQLYQNVREALKKERAEKKQMREQFATPENPEPVYDSSIPQAEEEIQRRFLSTEERAIRGDIAYRLQTEPDFKQMAPLVEEVMRERGLSIEEAATLVKAKLWDMAAKDKSEAEEVPLNKPKQLKPTATPEPQAPKLTGNVLKDAAKGKYDNVPPELREVLSRHLKEM